jgi:cytochrome c oxidase cbb3-type subunit III
LFGWSSAGAYAQESDQLDRETAPLYAKYLQQDLLTVAADPSAHAMGQRLFLNYCAPCHGSDGRGSKGFPNLADDDWLYGDGDDETPQDIKKTISDGRAAVMPAFGATLGEQGVKNIANYVRSLSGLTYDEHKAAAGKATFSTVCAACHGADGKGNKAMGAPNLTDKVWLYGGSEAAIIETITLGRNGTMPAHGPLLGEGKVQVLTAYVWSLSHSAKPSAQSPQK